MRILHTSDWHLGRLFHRASLLAEQRTALARIIELVHEHRIQLVVVAGDLYDRSIPPADAVELFDRTLLELHSAGATVVAISGNHDSAVRVGYGDRLLEQIGVTVRGDASRSSDPVLVAADDGAGPVAVYPIPYLDPLATSRLATPSTDAPDSPADTDSPADAGEGSQRRFTHHDAMAWATAKARDDLRARRDAGQRVRSVVVAHTFLTGGNPSESERELSLGHVDQVRLDVFDGFDYVALGHLHQGQAFDGGRVAYSGTPLRYSFSEERNQPSVRLIELHPDGSLDVDVVRLEAGRPMQTIAGELDGLLEDPGLHDAESAWVRVRLTDRTLPLQAMARLQRRFPFAVELQHAPAGASAEPSERLSTEQVRRADPIELADRFLVAQRGIETAPAEHAVLAEAIASVHRGGDR